MSSRLVMAAGTVGVDAEKRTLSGIVVPYGKTGATTGGRLKFSAGSLTFTDPRRVKLLREHDQRDVLGFGLAFEERPEGLWGSFHVPESDDGDRALREAAEGLRDAFSVGVELDDATIVKLRRANGGAVDGRGALREVSQVSVPAFDDARLAANADLVVTRWDSPEIPTMTAGAAGSTTGGSPDMTEQQQQPAPGTNPEQPTPTPPTNPEQPTPAPGEQPAPGVTTASGPVTVRAAGGAAHVTAEPPAYTFDGRGHSVIRDLFASHMQRDAEAGERVARFNAQLSAQEPGALDVFVTAAATREDIDGAGTDLPPAWGGGTNYRRDMMRELVDVKRPIISRVTRTPLTNAQPFAIPTVGEFDGVGQHTEGTPHVPAGTLTLGAGDVIQPRAVSGAWEVSRELLDATNPVLDRIASRAMLRDYRRKSEGMFVTLLDALAASQGVAYYGVDTAMELRAALIDMVNDDDEPADLLIASKGLTSTILTDVDNQDRAQIPFVGAANALGQVNRAGYTGVTIDGVEMVRAARLDAGVTDASIAGGVGVLAREEGLFWGESNVLQYRFDEVLGPGVVKLALWAYNAAAILDTDDVALIASGADPTP